MKLVQTKAVSTHNQTQALVGLNSLLPELCAAAVLLYIPSTSTVMMLVSDDHGFCSITT
jgi:hypothetical protein